MRVLGVDYGSARCGCAVSDPTGVLVTPLEPVLAPGTRRGLAALRKLVGELGAERVVVGLPLTLGGGDSQQTSETRAFTIDLTAPVVAITSPRDGLVTAQASVLVVPASASREPLLVLE